MKISALCLTIIVVMLGCDNKNQRNSPQPDQLVSAILTTLPKKLPTDDPSLPDRPIFGGFATTRQQPFSFISSEPDEVRLQKILHNGRLQREYFYNTDGKLSELKNYYNDGHLYSSTRFLYLSPTTTRIELWMNKAEMGGGGYPSSNDLLQYSFYTYTTTNSGSELVKTLEIGADNRSSFYKNEYRLGFDESGQWIWEEETDPKGENFALSGNYSLIKRDTRGNVSENKYVYGLERSVETTIYEYDQHKNPYRTTRNFANQLTTNPNNATRISTKNSQGGTFSTQYVYEYRQDGYPSKVTKINTYAPQIGEAEPPFLIEFIYNR